MKIRNKILPWIVLGVAILCPWQIAQVVAAADPAAVPAAAPTISIDKTTLENGGVITVTGTAPAGKSVYLEVWASDHSVRSSRFDSDKDKQTGKIPYIFYITKDMPAYYTICVPKDMKLKIDAIKKEGKKWSYASLLRDLGAEAAYSVPAAAKIDRYQASLMASVVGSRGEILPAMDDKENRQRSMQLVKARFQSIDKLVNAAVDVRPDGSFTADIKIRHGLAPGKYTIVAVVDKDSRKHHQLSHCLHGECRDQHESYLSLCAQSCRRNLRCPDGCGGRVYNESSAFDFVPGSPPYHCGGYRHPYRALFPGKRHL